jgi:hypothetical protein
MMVNAMVLVVLYFAHLCAAATCTWDCVTLSNKTVGVSNPTQTPVVWTRQNCTCLPKGPLAKTVGPIIVNIAEADISPGSKWRGRAGVSDGGKSLATLSAIAAGFQRLENGSTPFSPLVGINGGYFWRTDDKTFIDDVCIGTIIAMHLHNSKILGISC